jgi:hypothetical protein
MFNVIIGKIVNLNEIQGKYKKHSVSFYDYLHDDSIIGRRGYFLIWKSRGVNVVVNYLLS